MKKRRILVAVILCAYLGQIGFVPNVLANAPVLNSSTAGVSFTGVGTSHLTITSTALTSIVNAPLGFDIARTDVTNVNQAQNASMLVRIGGNLTHIDGHLNAMGQLVLLNPNGVIFGPSAQINVGSLIVSSLALSNADFMRGYYLFQGAGIEGPVKNMGAIDVSQGGVYLLAPNVENSGVITSPRGNIVLAAGAKAYLSNRPDGRGFLAEISNPIGEATNLKDLIADGGNITMAGRVVNQQGLVQANTVREQRGKIELYASETLTLKAGSQTLAKGGKEGLSDGGTILAIADKFAGSAKFEKGATLDVSGGRAGGHAGFVELSGSRVGLGGKFIGAASQGFRGGRLLIDPTTDLDLTGFAATDFSNISFATPRDAGGNLLPGYDLRVTGFFDLNSVQPPPTGGTIRFDAGQDLIFRDLILWNNPFGASSKWDIVGVADRSILFTGFAGTTLQTAYGGGIDLTAKTGNVNLIDPQTGALSTIRTQGGGGISIKTGLDLIASTGLDPNGGPLGLFNVKGINIDGPGRLNLDVGRDFIGGLADGVPSGPGFVLWNSDTTVPLPQHTVNVGRNIGETNLSLGSNGLPLTAAEVRAQGKAVVAESSARNADFALSGGELTVSAGGNVYVGRVRDAGLVGGLDTGGNPRDPQFSTGLENNRVTIISREGNVILNTNPVDARRQTTPLEVLSGLLPASFNVRADKGTIQIRSNLKFLPSPAGSVNFYAKQDIQGVSKTRRGNDPNFIWLFVGYGGISGGQWVAVDKRTLQQRPDLLPFLANVEGSKSLPPRSSQDQTPPSDFPDYALMDVDRSPPTVKLLEINPNNLVGNTSLDQVLALVNNNRPIAADNPIALAPVTFKAESGNISNLVLDLVSRPFHKEISIEAGNRIEQFNANIYLPDLGTQTQTVTERVPLFVDPTTGKSRPITSNDVILIHDPVTGVVRPWDKTESVDPANLVNVVIKDVIVTVNAPNPAATITANDIVLNQSASGDGGIQFSGPGTAKVIAKHNLDLADGRGINLERDKASDQGGLLDIAVGNNLDMVISGIFSKNGAGISIHGYDPFKPYVLGYDNSSLYPLEFPDSLRGGINLPAVGGRVNVGENSLRSAGGSKAPTGIQVINGGSVGQMATAPIVNPDGTVTVNVVKDPAAILIRATGDIDVNKSRIATFGGGDIRLTSLQGNINAGSGSKKEQVLFSVDTGANDSQGNRIFKTYKVPGSGIFTFHPDDPQPLASLFPTFNDPEINALLAQADREGFFGRDVSQLLAKANKLRAERETIFNETVLNPFIDRLKLGDIALTAESGAHGPVPANGTGRIIIPEAGILGRNVTLRGVLDFRGGSVTGRVILPPNPTVVGTPNIPVLSPPGVGAPPPPLTGGGAVGAASTTAVASSTSAKSTDSVQETAVESSSRSTQGKQVASKNNDDKDGKRQVATSVRVKRGVVIQVDVKPEVKAGS